MGVLVLAKAHSEFIIACFVIASRWDECTETERKRFYDECINRFGADVIRQTVTELEADGKLFNVVEYCREQLFSV